MITNNRFTPPPQFSRAQRNKLTEGTKVRDITGEELTIASPPPYLVKDPSKTNKFQLGEKTITTGNPYYKVTMIDANGKKVERDMLFGSTDPDGSTQGLTIIA